MKDPEQPSSPTALPGAAAPTLLARNDALRGEVAEPARALRDGVAELARVDGDLREPSDSAIAAGKRAKDGRRSSDMQLRATVGAASAGVAHVDLDGCFTLVNPNFCHIVERLEAELLGSSMFDLIVPDDRAGDEASFRRVVTEAISLDGEKRLVRGDAVICVDTVTTALRDDDGRATSAVIVVLDIARRRESEQALRTSQERLRLVLENAREYAIVSMDLGRRITGWNSGAEMLLGYTEAESTGRLGDIIFTADDRAAGMPEQEARQALAEGRAADERWQVRKDGSRFWGSGVMMAMRDGGGGPIGLLKILRDQSAARAAREALETSRAELVQTLIENRIARGEAEAANEAKDRFLAVLSHELRTPMTPVVMALHALERMTDLPASARPMLDVVRRNVRAELHLIDDLLDVTRISSGKLELAHDSVDMHEVARAAADVCAGHFSVKRQRLTLSLDASRHNVRGDAARLQQAVWNLLSNAAKFTPAEGDIRVETRTETDRFVLAVADTGLGIESTALTTIFEAFAQEGSWVTSEFGGLGLGLAIAKATVEAHHGVLAAASGGRDRGATFTISLPLEYPQP